MLAIATRLALGAQGLAKQGFALLGRLSISQLACIGLFVLAALFFVQRNNARDDLELERINNNELRAELKAISDAKNKQAERTKVNIGKAEKGNKEADRKAREIESAPTAPDCKTPPEIMGADL